MATAHGLISNPKHPIILDEAELDWDDLEALPRCRGVGQQQLSRIRAVHHKVAQMMASGMAHVEIASATGMSQAYISILRRDPAFQELLHHYTEQEDERWRDVREQAAMVGMTATQELHDRLLTRPNDISTKDLLNVMSQGLDYGGHKPPERSQHHHVVTASEEIADIKSGRKENVSVRRGPSGDDSGGDDIIDAEYRETESGTEVREASADGDSEAGSGGEKSLDRLLG